jgi:PIN domain nuclease of toxin-antitoxin system
MGDEPLLLDTCAFLDWALGGAMAKRALSELERASREGRAFLSPLSVQETMRLSEKGRLVLHPTPLSWMQRALRKMRLSEASFTWDAALEAGALVDVNGDPVDRGLLGAAIAGGFTLATRDEDLLRAARRKGVRAIDTRPR